MNGSPVIAHVFSGGGFNGAASSAQQVRVYQMGSRPTIFTGESIGAYLAYLTALTSPMEVDALWAGLGPRDFYSGGSGLDKLLTLLGRRHGIYNMRPALDTLTRIVAGRRLPTWTWVVVTRTDLKYGVLREDTLTSDTLPSSCCELVYQSGLVPLVHGARDCRWADGGICACAPLGPAVRAGADHCEVFALDLPGVPVWRGGSAIEEAGRAVDVLRDHLVRADLKLTAARNRYPRAGDRQISARYWMPIEPLPDWMDASPDAIGARRRVRYRAATLDEYVAQAEAGYLAAVGQSVVL